ncbi:sulfatase, partial [bacterium]|nr:sulfatase [bacterium]
MRGNKLGKPVKRYIYIVIAFLLVCVSLILLRERKGYNVLLITIDSLKPGHLGCYGYGRNTSPNLDKIAREGVLFTQAYSTAGWTLPGLASLLSSQYPSVHGIQRRDDTTLADIPTFARLLKQRGYHTPGACFLLTMPEFVNLGFDILKDAPMADDDKALISRLKEIKDKKFFLWHHYTIPHLPYNPPPSYLAKFCPQDLIDKEDSRWMKEIQSVPIIRKDTVANQGGLGFGRQEKEKVISLYDGDVSYLDSILGGLMDELSSLNLEDNTILIITADHGEELFEHGFLGHSSTSLNSSLYNEQLHIPLIIRFPSGIYSDKKVTLKTSLVDVLPTVLDYLGIERQQYLQGISLMPFIKNPALNPQRPIFAEASVSGYQTPQGIEPIWQKALISEGWKLISKKDGDALSYELYNLNSDPQETTNLIDEETERALKLKMRLGQWTLSNEMLRARLSDEEKEEEIHAQFAGQTPIILKPAEKEALDFNLNNAQVSLEWTGNKEERYVVEYSAGEGDRHLAGTFEINDNSKTFGPIYKETWGLLNNFNPFRIRVRRYRGAQWSEWREFYFPAQRSALDELLAPLNLHQGDLGIEFTSLPENEFLLKKTIGFLQRPLSLPRYISSLSAELEKGAGSLEQQIRNAARHLELAPAPYIQDNVTAQLTPELIQQI